MEAKKIIDALGGQQKVATLLNAIEGSDKHTRHRIWNWYATNHIPAWAQIEYAKVWRRAQAKLARAGK